MLYSYCLISPYTGNLYALYIEIRNANSLKSMHLKLDGRDLLLKLSSHCSTKRKKPCLGNDRKVRTCYKSSESLSSFSPRIWALCYVRRSGQLQRPDEKRGVRSGRPGRRSPVLAAASLARWVAPGSCRCSLLLCARSFRQGTFRWRVRGFLHVYQGVRWVSKDHIL